MKGGRRQVALADPERNQPLAAAPVVEDFDDAALRHGAHGGLNFAEPVGRRAARLGKREVHRRLMNGVAIGRKGRARRQIVADRGVASRRGPRLYLFASALDQGVADLRQQHDFVARRRGSGRSGGFRLLHRVHRP